MPREQLKFTGFDFLGRYELVRLGVPAQPIVATPSNPLIQQHFPKRTDLFGRTRSNPASAVFGLI
jgi:hypothetical protein